MRVLCRTILPLLASLLWYQYLCAYLMLFAYPFVYSTITHSVLAEVRFKHVPVKHDPFEYTHEPKCPTYKIDDSDLEIALKHGLVVKDKIGNLENQLDLTQNIVNTTLISSTARHVIPSISKDHVRLMHHQQLAFEEASRVLAKKYVFTIYKRKMNYNYY